MHHAPWIDPRRMQSANQVDVNSSQPQNEGDSIGSIIFKGIMSPSGTQNGTYYQYLVNQSQVEMGVPVNSGQSKVENTTTTTTTTQKPPSESSKSNVTVVKQLDTTKGVITRHLYESGHIDSPEICPDNGETIKLLIIITSAPVHREARLAIRQTWGHFGSRRDIAVAFLVGAAGQTLDDSIAAENYMYNDIIRGRFVDSYNNLTLKTISMLEWVDEHCPKASFILKTDDDMFINVPKLLQFAEKKHADKRTIYGRLAKKWKPIRNKKSKYYVSLEQYKPPIFPQFTTGPAYLLTSDCVSDLYKKALNLTYLKLEDVYTTGIVAQEVNVKRVLVNEFLNRRIAFNACNIKKSISLHMIKPPEMFDLWKKLLDTTVKCK